MTAAAMVFVGDLGLPSLTTGDAHHLVDVLRLRPGETVVASDGAGRWVPCRVGPGTARGRRARDLDPAGVLVVDGPVTSTIAPRPAVMVGFAPSKGDRPEWVIQKLTELGVDRIIPIRSARSVVRWEGERGDRAVARLRRVAREAAAQCRRPWLPEVSTATALDALAARTGVPTCLAHPGGRVPSLDPPLLAVGPEGGWDPDELARHGPGVGLGPHVLRAETAALAAGAVLCALRSGMVGSLA
ncbi:MAG: RsmE family RNA methyltransferase [Acidimicrobiales bacterium]